MSTNIVKILLMRKSIQKNLRKKLLIQTVEGIVEERFVTIGGIEQWITIRGEDRQNPVLFFVHGGPGSTYEIFTPLLRSWEKHFTIVQWDQRGAGKTLRKNGKSSSRNPLSLERLIKDGIELAAFLHDHLHQKIILVGSSVGSLIGTNIVKRRPDLFSAYVGTDQNIGIASLAASYQLTVERLRAAGNRKDLDQVEKMIARKKDFTPQRATQLNQLIIKTTPNVPNMITDIILPAMLTSPNHSLSDLMDILNGMKMSNEQLFEELHSIDLRKIGMCFEVPFFIIQGDMDPLTPAVTAQAYFEELEAPHKQFVLIQQAGHLAVFARPEEFLQELLQKVRPLVTGMV